MSSPLRTRAKVVALMPRLVSAAQIEAKVGRQHGEAARVYRCHHARSEGEAKERDVFGEEIAGRGREVLDAPGDHADLSARHQRAEEGGED